MDKIINNPIWTTHALLVGRVLMAALFILAGVGKFQAIDQTAGYIASMGIPMAILFAWLAATLEVAAGLALIVGKYFKEAAIALAVFTFIISFIFHSPSGWSEDTMQRMMFMKNMAIVGGLLFMAAHGAGNTWKIK